MRTGTAAQPRDPLTGLPSRAHFADLLERALGTRRSRAQSITVLAVDIDHFHLVNDEFGHDVGDGVLVVLAERLRSTVRMLDTVVRGDDPVTRVGADGFLVLCEAVTDVAAAEAIARRLLAALCAPMKIGDRDASLTASIGIAISDVDSDPRSLVSDAQAAQRRAQELGGARHQFFTDVLRDKATLANALREALVRDEFRLVYQPKISLATDRIVGVEALLRWECPGRGLLQPSEFIPAAELTELIIPIGAWVVREACRDGVAWHAAYPRSSVVQIAVNVAACQFRVDLPATIRAAIAETGIAPTTLCVEMTETTVMNDIDATVAILEDLKTLGVTASIDDFGTGYSSLQYLHRMPIDEVKIDRTFVDGLGTNPQDTAIVASVISLAHAMDLDVVAEGVETSDQLERLRSLGCDFAQGFFIARPMPAADIRDLLAADAAGRALPHRTSTDAAIVKPTNETILVVDDAADVRMMARMSLTAAGLNVEEADDGTSALAMAVRLQPDCVLLDVSMPGMTGIDVCRGLRADLRTADCTIVMLTTNADAADKAEAFLVGADDYIVKPFTPRDLVARVCSAIRRRRATIGTVGTQIDSVLFELLNDVRDRAADAAVPEGDQMTSRQMEILKRLVAGERVPAIARALYVSQSTVRNHLSGVFQKLGVHSQEELLQKLRARNRTVTAR